MDIFESYVTDETAEVEGRWFPLDKTTKVLVASTGSSKYKRALSKRLKSDHVDLKDSSEENEKFVTSIIVDVMSDTLLLDWKGVKFKGVDLPYSKANAVKALTVKGFRDRINSIAAELESFLVKEEEDQGNA
jgi:hypothetical protein